MKQRLIIYDLEEGISVEPNENTLLFSAAPLVKHCVGCFGCWVKTPGKCVIKDRAQVMPSYLSKSQEVIIISPMLYGGFSQNIKSVLDRSIGYILPYFRIVNGEMHHQLRHTNEFRLKVYFYGAVSKEEERIAKELVQANAINLGIKTHEVLFLPTAKDVKEAIA